ncbi:MAG: Ig domain-containing protein [Faecalibacterium sp.]
MEIPNRGAASGPAGSERGPAGCPLPAQAAPGVLTGLTGTGSKLELELTEMELEITDDDPRPKGYLYTSGQSDYYFIVWMSSNSNVATVDGDGKVTGRNAGTAIITAISDHGERAACKVTVTRKNEESARKSPRWIPPA